MYNTQLRKILITWHLQILKKIIYKHYKHDVNHKIICLQNKYFFNKVLINIVYLNFKIKYYEKSILSKIRCVQGMRTVS